MVFYALLVICLAGQPCHIDTNRQPSKLDAETQADAYAEAERWAQDERKKLGVPADAQTRAIVLSVRKIEE